MDGLQAVDLQELVAIARSVGWGAAGILLDAQKTGVTVQETGDGPVTSADTDANYYILENLKAAFGTTDFGYLSEETYKTAPTGKPLPQPLVWVIDPLDGTSNFIQGTGEYAVHIALLQADRPILSVVACPAAETLYFAVLHGGTFVEHVDGSIHPVQVSQKSKPEDLIVVASRTHRGERFDQLLKRFPSQKQLSIGSVGGKIATIVEQKADVYVSLAGKSAPKDWDLAAPELILTEAGGKFTHFDGTLLQYNQADVSQWKGVLASNALCHEVLCTETRRILAEIDAIAQ